MAPATAGHRPRSDLSGVRTAARTGMRSGTRDRRRGERHVQVDGICGVLCPRYRAARNVFDSSFPAAGSAASSGRGTRATSRLAARAAFRKSTAKSIIGAVTLDRREFIAGVLVTALPLGRQGRIFTVGEQRLELGSDRDG